MSVMGFLRLVDPDNPAILILDILFWSVIIILFVLCIVVRLNRK